MADEGFVARTKASVGGPQTPPMMASTMQSEYHSV